MGTRPRKGAIGLGAARRVLTCFTAPKRPLLRIRTLFEALLKPQPGVATLHNTVECGFMQVEFYF